MTIRTIRTVVEFRHPFTLPFLDAEQPAGKYRVETEEELIEGLSVEAYRRIGTTLYLAGNPRAPGVSEEAMIDPADLTAALARDAAHVSPTRGETP